MNFYAFLFCYVLVQKRYPVNTWKVFVNTRIKKLCHNSKFYCLVQFSVSKKSYVFRKLQNNKSPKKCAHFADVILIPSSKFQQQQYHWLTITIDKFLYYTILHYVFFINILIYLSFTVMVHIRLENVVHGKFFTFGSSSPDKIQNFRTPSPFSITLHGPG